MATSCFFPYKYIILHFQKKNRGFFAAKFMFLPKKFTFQTPVPSKEGMKESLADS